MVDFTPKGKVSVKKTLTKMGNLSKSQKKPSIKIMPSKDGEVHVIEGKKVTVNDLKDTMKKVKELEEKNKGKVFKHSNKQFEKNVKEHAQELVNKKRGRPRKQELITEDQFIDEFDTQNAAVAFSQHNPKGAENLVNLLSKLNKKKGFFLWQDALASGLYIPLPTVKKLVLKYGFKNVKDYTNDLARYMDNDVRIRDDIHYNPFETKLAKVLRFTKDEFRFFKDDPDYIDFLKICGLTFEQYWKSKKK
jgi:hypothetical protein